MRRCFNLIVIFAFSILLLACEAGNKTPKGVETISKEKKEQEKPKVPVLGWHRTKEGVQSYNYEALNMLAYFSYKVNPSNGEAEESIDWANDPIIDSAQAKNCSVYLTITNFGYSKNAALLSNQKACDTLIKRVSNMLVQRNAAGVCVDFEEIHQKDSSLFAGFIQQLGQELKKNKHRVMVVLPIAFQENIVNAKVLKTSVDYFVMMGYACYHLKSHHAGPISPYQSGDIWEPYNINDNVDQYLEHSFPKEQFMVALPLYGTIWETETINLNSRSVKGIKEISYNKVMELVEKDKVMLDSVSQSSYCVYREGEKIMQCWFESKENLAYKINQLLKEKSIGGIGFWAMGYANEHPDVWKMVEEKCNPSR
ncbi:MAG: glycosyl hydrolase family 18 protein [Flavobacteriales bacterium]|jgi:spore germination protein YaaH|nr:glycosyl hydrolase family 18 protein [Flavobacteriales bacterium]